MSGEGGLAFSAPQVFNISEFAVQEPDEVQMLGADIVVESCPLLGRTVCQRHPEHALVTAIHNGMKALVDRLGKATVGTGDVLVMFEGRSPRGLDQAARRRIFALVSQVNYSPKFQDWTVCEPEDKDDLSREVLALPSLVSIGLVPLPPNLFAGDGLCIHHETGDDLALEMAGLALEWTLSVCQYELLTPMEMRVAGVEPSADLHIQCRAGKGHQARRRAVDVDKELAGVLQEAAALSSLGDPLSSNNMLGRARRRTSAQSAPALVRARASAPNSAREARGAPLAEAVGEEEGLWGHLAPEDSDDHIPDDLDVAVPLERPPLADVALSGLAEGLLIPVVDRSDIFSADIAGDGVQPPVEVAAASLVDTHSVPGVASSSADGRPSADELLRDPGAAAEMAAEVLDMALRVSGIDEATPSAGATADSAAVLVAPAAPAAPEAMVPSPTPASSSAAPQAADGDSAQLGAPIQNGPSGWTMTSTGHVFCNERRYRGRISSWDRNVSVSCTLHGCRKAKSRAKLTDGQLAQWLADGVAQCPPRAGVSKDTLKKEHQRMFPL